MANLTKIEAAKRLRVSTRTLDRLHNEGTGPARMMLGKGTVLYREEDIAAYEEGLAEGGTITPTAKRVMTRAAQMFEMILRWKMSDEAREILERARDDLRKLINDKPKDKEAA